MPLSLSSQASKINISSFPSGSIVQSAFGRNTTSATKIFTTRSTYEAVPG
jgi:hypothetical protein